MLFLLLLFLFLLPASGTAAGCWQTIVCDLAIAYTRPADTAVIIGGDQLDFPCLDFLVSVISIFDFYGVIFYSNLLGVLALNIFLIGQPGIVVFLGPVSIFRIVFFDCRFRSGSKRQAFGYLCADGVILLIMNCDGRNCSDNCDIDHEFDQCKSL